MNTRQEKREIASRKIKESLDQNNFREAVDLFLDLLPGDQVEIFEILDDDDQDLIVAHLDITSTADLFDVLEDSETLEAAEGLSIERLADILDEMQPDEAADLLGDLPPDQASKALEQMEDIEDVLPLLPYSDETAGGRMTTVFVSMHRDATTTQAISHLRDVSPDLEVPYYIFIIDDADHLAGVVGLRELVISPPNTVVEDIMDPDVVYSSVNQDQEDVAQIMARYDLSALPVIDESNRLVGVITHDDILDVVTEEATEDIYRLANVGDVELEPDSEVGEHLKGRLPWLYLNTLTALFASWVISNFESLIGAIAVLAVFQSVVAGQGGNAASQSVALMVRALALGKISKNKVWKILRRQILVSILQGLAVGSVVGVGVAIWRGNPFLGIVLGLALVGNMLIAGIAGTLIPLGLNYIGQDPALASSVLVTAVTDSLGFFIFLSLASIFMSQIK